MTRDSLANISVNPTNPTSPRLNLQIRECVVRKHKFRYQAVSQRRAIKLAVFHFSRPEYTAKGTVIHANLKELTSAAPKHAHACAFATATMAAVLGDKGPLEGTSSIRSWYASSTP